MTNICSHSTFFVANGYNCEPWSALQARFKMEANSPSADPESFVKGGPTLTTFWGFLVEEGRKDQNTTISGPSSVSLACRYWPNIECLLGTFVFFRGSGPVWLRNPISL